MPLYGHELGETINPYAGGVGWAVKLAKGEFVGREALKRFKRDPGQTRVGLELAGKRIARQGCVVRHEGKEVGVVTSGTFARRWAKAWRWPLSILFFKRSARRLKSSSAIKPSRAGRAVAVLSPSRAEHTFLPVSSPKGSEPMFEPSDLKFSETHEWVHLDGDVATVGVSALRGRAIDRPDLVGTSQGRLESVERQELRRDRERQVRQRRLLARERRGDRDKRRRHDRLRGACPTILTEKVG